MQPQVSFVFQKLPDVCPIYNTTRLPPYTFLQRLREFPPSLRDLIVVVSTGAPDVGLISRSKVPLTNAFPHDKVTDVFTTTTVANDARRAQLPINPDFTETTAIGVSLDLSAQQKVTRPLPGEEIEESRGPLPGVMVLNNEGVLSFWWLIYADSIRQGTTYPGLVLGTQQEQGQTQTGHFGSNTTAATPNLLGGVSALSGTVTSPFNKPATPATWATNTAGSGGFGTTSGLGKQPSPWRANSSNAIATQSASPGFGQPAFGQPGGFPQPEFGTTSALGSQGAAFGMAGTIGNRVSPWAAAPGTSGSAFGQAGVPGMGSGNTSAAAPASSPFGSNSTGGFTKFAKAPGFSAVAAQGRLDSGFGQGSPGVPFSSGIESDTSFSGINKTEDGSSSLFKNNTFVLGSTFKGDGTAANDLPKPPTASNSLFGTNIDESLDATSKGALTPPSQEAEMNDDISDGGKSSPLSSMERESITPVENPDIAKSPSATVPPSHGGYFGTQAQSSVTPASVEASAPAVPTADLGDGSTPITTTPKETPRKSEISRTSNETTPTPPIKRELENEHTSLNELSANTAEPSLPPEPTSKASYTPGDTSSSSIDTPLPQESVASRGKTTTADGSPQNGGDGNNVSEDDEGSGVDVAEEISPTTDPNQSPKATPGSSFGASFDKSPLGGRFTKVSQHQNRPSKPLFGEVGQKSIPFFRQPVREPESPRSPSPVRPIFPRERQRPENARSFTAPSQPAKVTSLEAERKLRDKLRAKKAQQAAEEDQELSDREDEKVREELATEVEPTKDLAPFLAHQDYVGGVNKPGVAGQIETVYRDINSMLDTLGLNARSLKAFVNGHSEFFQRNGRGRKDLETEDWCLVEIWELNKVESQLVVQLDKGRLRSVQEKMDTCRDYRTALKKIRSKRYEIARIADAKSDPEQIEAKKSAALDSDQSLKQHELRKDFSNFQKLLAQAEENISLLRAKLASFEVSNGKSAPLRKPTVEAVTSTIKKMTSMVEKKTIDIDLLEAEMLRLRFPSVSVNGFDGREQSPFTSSLRSSTLNSSPSRTAGESQTPRMSGNNLRKSFGESGTPGKRMSKITNEDVTRYRTKVQRRSEINAVIKKALLDSGPRLRNLE